MFGKSGRAVAIAGIGQTSYARRDERSETQLAAEAALAACADAGIAAADVDGMITYTIDPADEIGMIRALGVRDLAFTSRVPGGGAGALATVYQAAAAKKKVEDKTLADLKAGGSMDRAWVDAALKQLGCKLTG